MDLLEHINGYGYGYGDGYGYGYGDGYGYGYSSGFCYGDGSGDGYGNGYGYGYGSGNGYGDGDGYGYGYSSGYGDGYGSGNGSGYGYGSGSGSGDGSGDGYGNGSGDGNGYGISEFEGVKKYVIDGMQTYIEAFFGPYAKGFTLSKNCVKTACYVALHNGYAAHGSTLREAVEAAMKKEMESLPLEERIGRLVQSFPDPDAEVPCRQLYEMHHILTSSCDFGRRKFCDDRGINIENDSMTVRDFISITKNEYGGDAIKKLAENYGIET